MVEKNGHWKEASSKKEKRGGAHDIIKLSEIKSYLSRWASKKTDQNDRISIAQLSFQPVESLHETTSDLRAYYTINHLRFH